MRTNTNLEIHFSRKKILRLVAFGCIFILLGIWLVFFPPEGIYSINGIPVSLPLVGGIALLFFGSMTGLLLSKAYSNRPALVLDSLGLEDRSSYFSAGYIHWQDLTSVSLLQLHGQEMIMLNLANPEKYITREGNLFKRLLLRLNGKLFKGHYTLSTNSLDISTEELLGKLQDKIAEHSQRMVQN